MKISKYLSDKGIAFKEDKGELITACLFNDCDKDSKGKEAHLYFNAETGQYDCKKCGSKGNIHTLAKFLGDDSSTLRKPIKEQIFSNKIVEKYHADLPAKIREYLNNRGISDEVIDSFKLGYGSFYGKNFITIPISTKSGKGFFKLREDPSTGSSKTTYPKGAESCLYGYTESDKDLIICEGELDALALISRGYYALTSTHGALTFKEEWVDESIKEARSVYVCMDNDEAGVKGTEKVLDILEKSGLEKIYRVTLPAEVGEHGDITDYLTKLNLTPEGLLNTCAKQYPEKIDPSLFSPIGKDDISKILELTIKKDEVNKVITLLSYVSAYTEDSQTNLSFNSPSSTGKSYTALEVAKLFPKEDVIKLANCSPTAFFHEQGTYDKEKNEMTVDLSRKIIIFTDMPHPALLSRLRSFLSHDEKDTRVKMTDKSDRGGHRTKTVILKGYASIVYCSAGLRMDPQEMTRLIMLTPDTDQEKIRAGITNAVLMESSTEKLSEGIENNEARRLLKLRIRAIKQEKIGEIKIANTAGLLKEFLKPGTSLQPRHMRDVKKLMSLVKAMALMNLWWRERSGNTITANEDDVIQALALWRHISSSQELNISPYAYEIFKKVIVPAFEEKNKGKDSSGAKDGITRKDITIKHYDVFERRINLDALRLEIIPTLESAGLITCEKDSADGRKEVVFINNFDKIKTPENNVVDDGGVKTKVRKEDLDTAFPTEAF
ncbi:MAG: toprim domain-containing protein [bacterium]